MSRFEAALIHHAAPTLLGKKQANLFSFPFSVMPEYQKEIAAYQKQLAPFGICITYLYSCKNRIFVLVYRPAAMLRRLRVPSVRKHLISLGYPDTIGQKNSLDSVLRYLRKRTLANGDFPHEIGFFLGYPPADVFSFIQKKGMDYKYVGYWKVYGDEEKALRIFQLYEDCRDNMMQQAEAGVSLISLIMAA